MWPVMIMKDSSSRRFRSRTSRKQIRRHHRSSLRRWAVLPALTLLLGFIAAGYYVTRPAKLIAFAEQYLSRLSGGQVHIEDLGNTAGTYVNNQRLAVGETLRLRNGDQIRLGELLIVFMYYGDAQSARLI